MPRSRDITAPLGKLHLLPRSEARQASRLGGYEIIAPLARGGMGGVYLGKEVATDERVAIKVLDPHFARYPELVSRLFAEHTISARVNHPGLLKVRSTGFSAEGIPYIVMEYLDGENLGALADRGTVEIGALISLGAQIAAAVAALHDVGVVHCDVKPENVLVLYQPGPSGWPQIKVIDFGVSRFVDEPPCEDSSIAGTPSCMAPEQWGGAPTPRSDVYALGCLLFELATGAPLFSGTLPQLMIAHSEQRPERPSLRRKNLPLELERLMLRALAKDPGMRPTMKEMSNGLREIARGQALGEVHVAAG